MAVCLFLNLNLEISFSNLAGTLCSINCVMRINWELINSVVISSYRSFFV